jgi:long-chain acyl-CoA synthetase
LRGLEVQVRKEKFPGCLFLQDLLKYEPKPPKVEISPRKDVAILCYSGGTTGIPKGCMLTHYNCVVNNLQKILTWKLREAAEVTLIYLPLYHIYGLNWCLNTGMGLAATIILFESFNLVRVLRAIEKYRVTIFYGVPPVYTALVNYPEIEKHDLSSVRIWMSAAAPLLPEIRRKFKELTGIDIVECWGLTEASPCLTFTPLGLKEVKPNLIGIPTLDTEVAIFDPDTGAQLPPNEIGELRGRGPQVMLGYWNKPEETEKALEGKWLRTGDLGYMSEDGLFYFVDRIKDVINVAGFKVWPIEVEDVLQKHPAVVGVAVVSTPHEYYGEVPKAFIVLKEEYVNKVSEEELIEFCKERLAKYKAPQKVEFVKELPKTPSGKILRRLLRDREWKKRK